MVPRLVTGILAVTLLPLGLVFVIIGATADSVQRGTPEGFLYAGVPIAAAGLVCPVVFVLLTRRETARRRRRAARATAEVLSVRLSHNVRSGAKVRMQLTVRIPGGEPVSGRFMVVPGREPAPGSRIEVAYDRDDTANFEPVQRAG